MRERRLPPRRALLLGLAAALAVPVLGSPSPVSADDGPAPGETIVGELVQGYADPGPEDVEHGDHADPGLLSWVRTAPGESVRVPTEDLGEATVGDTVEVTLGGEVHDEAAAAGLEPAVEVSEAQVLREAPAPVAPAGAPVDHPVTVVMVQPAGAVRDGATLAGVLAAVNGPVADFWAEQTDGAVRFRAVAGGDWATSSFACDDPVALWNEAARRAGWVQGAGRHLLLYVPAGSPGCSYGLGSVGTGTGSGGVAYVQATATSVIAHEFGHNLGLGHSSLLHCESAVDAGVCGIRPYYDMYDVMGVSWDRVGSLSAPHAALLRVSPSGSTPGVAAGAGSTQVFLSPVGARAGTRALQLTDADGEAYWLEYRSATGRDAWLGSPGSAGLQTGVLLRRSVDDSGDTALLLDASPSAQSQWAGDRAAALPTGGTVTFGDAAFRVTVHQVTGAGACVEVATGTAQHPMQVAGQRLSPVLGAATSGRLCGLRDGGAYQLFQRGAVYWSPGSGAWGVLGAISVRWGALGWEAGRLGYPTSDEQCGLRDAGCRQQFQRGAVSWSTATGAWMVTGAIGARWTALGAEGGSLGYPLSDERCGLPGGGCYQLFQGGAVYWSPGTGAHAVSGALAQRWAQLGWEAGRMGYPLTDPDCSASGCSQLFQGGWLTGGGATAVHIVFGGIRERWEATGSAGGALGHPTGDEVCGLRDRGCYQLFQRGSVYWSPATGARMLSGAINARWAALGWERGALGYPVTDPVCGLPDGGCRQDFQFGTLVGSASAPVRWVLGGIRDRWLASGGAAGPLGHPTTDEICGLRDRGCYQLFQRGSVYWSAATGAHALTGDFGPRWAAQGWENGPLGYPTGEAVRAADGTWSQQFERGTIRSS